jgi:hypothetical protein
MVLGLSQHDALGGNDLGLLGCGVALGQRDCFGQGFAVVADDLPAGRLVFGSSPKARSELSTSST